MSSLPASCLPRHWHLPVRRRPQYAAAEADDPAAAVSDREHDAVAESVIALAVVVLNQPGLVQPADRLRVRAELVEQVGPARRGEADPELGGDLAADAPAAQILGAAGRVGVAAQLPGIEAGGLFERVVDRAEIGAAVFAGLARDLEADRLGQGLDRLGEVQTFVLHQKAERGAVRPAAEAVIELLARADGEGGGLLVVEGAAGLVFAAGAFFSGTRGLITSTMSTREIRSSMKDWGILPGIGRQG